MFSFQIHNASNRFWSNGAVRMRGLLNPINIEGTSTVGNLGHASSQFQERAERGLHRVICGRSPFISARQGLRESEGSIATQHPVQSLPVPFEPVPLESSQARELRKPVERFTEVTLRAFAFSSIVMDGPAFERGLSVYELSNKLLSIIAMDGLVGAILDES